MATSTAQETSKPTLSGHKSWVLLLCFLVYTFNYVDRQILVILAEPIKHEFQLQDWQLGFLTGTAFALFYATLGIPIAYLADRWSRVNIIALSVAMWSAMTAACALSNNYAQLLAARIGVGIGEAGGSPPASSLLANYFSAGQRATAMGIYSLGPSFGLLIGFIVGGWVNEYWGWRIAMLIVALPGLLLAVLVKITMREPKRSNNNTEMKEGLGATFKYLSRKKTFNWTVAGAVSMGFAIYAFMTWMPSYLIRQHQLSTGEVGTIVGLSAGIAGSLGVFAGGYLADKWAKTKPSNLMLPPIVCTLLFFPAAVSALYVDSATAAIILLVPAYGLTLAHTGPTWAVLQNVAPENMRAMAAAIMLLGVNLFGLGLGPQSVGILSDLFQANFPAGSSLKFALAISMFPAILASLCYLMAGRALDQDIEDDQPFAATKN